MALTLTTSGSLNTTVDNYAFSILSNTSSVQLGAVSLKLVVPGGCTIKNVNAGTSSVDSLVFLQQDGNLNIGMYTLSNWVVNTNDVILSITASGMSTGSFTLNTDEDWYCEIASSSAEPFTDFAIRMPSLASPYASVSTTLEAVSILSGVNPSVTSVGAPNSSVFGSGSKTSGTASIAEGIGTLASGLASHAAGINTTASGQAAFSMGIETDADGMASFAAGSGSWAKGTATVAMGIGTIASASGQTVVGHYNLGLGDFNNLFVVGGGSGTTTNLRKNLFRVYGGSGASTVGVEINTSATQNTSTIEGFNIIGNTTFQGDISGSVRVGGSNIQLNDDSLNVNATSSFTILDTDRLTGPSPDFNKLVINRFGINFDRSNKSTSPGSKYLWTNSSDRLFYGSNAVILNGGNTLGSAMVIGTNDTNNLELETGGTTRVFISSTGNVGIGKSNPTARLDVSGSVITTGSLSVTGSLSLKGPLYDNLGTAGTADQILFTTSTGVEWRDNIANSAQDLIITGKNVGLTTIEKGTPLYFTGSGTSGNIVGILPADAGNPNRMPAGGVAGEQITAGSEGDVYIYGFISGVNTSAFNAGDSVFVGVGGGYTNIKPTGSALIQKLGNVEKVDSSNGSGIIQGPSWYNDLPNWEIGRVMVGRSTGQPVTSSLVYLDETNGRLGLGTTSPSVRLHVSGTSATNELVYLTGDASQGSAIRFNRGSSYSWRMGVTNASNFTIEDTSYSTARFQISHTSGLVGINTTSPNARLHISGANNEALLIASSSTAPSALFVSGSGRVAVGTSTPQRLFDVYNGSTSGIVASFGATFSPSNFSGISFGYVEQANASYRKSALVFERTETHGGGSNASGKIHFLLNNNSGTSATALTDAVLTIDSVGTTVGSSRVGIGTRFPTASLHISGTVATDNLMRVQSTTGAEYFFISASGNVGIGTATPTSRLQVSGSGVGTDVFTVSPAGAPDIILKADAVLTDYSGLYIGNKHILRSKNSSPVFFNIGDTVAFTDYNAAKSTMNSAGSLGLGIDSVGNILARLHARGTGATSATTALLVQNNNASASLVVTDDMRVGINKTTPNSTLDVNGNTTITGSLGIQLGSGYTGQIQANGNNLEIRNSNSGTHISINSTNTTTLHQVVTAQNGLNVTPGGNSTTAGLTITSGSYPAATLLRVGVNTLVVTGSNVGIGTTTPSASLHIEGNLQISTGSLYTYGQNTDIDSGSIRTVMSVATGSYRAAFFDYVLNKSTNARAGTVFSVWNGTSVEWNDVSTNDIGNTTEVNLSVGLSGANVVLYASSSTNDWSMKALSRML